jgi:hypothetical protein
MTDGDGSPQQSDVNLPIVTTGATRPLKSVRTPVSVRIFSVELVRASLALFSLALLIATVVLAWLSTRGTHWQNADKWLQIVLPAETAILGSALGFYFGDRKRTQDEN